jgi:hypothetical protein
LYFSNLFRYADFQIASSVIMVLAAWKWGDWKNWKLYYPTMLYYIVFDFLYALLTYNYPLWQYESPLLKTTFSDILLSFIFFPAKILLFLSWQPNPLIIRILYTIIWIIFGVCVEIFAHHIGFLSFHHGWTIWWSVLFDCILYPMLLLHYRKPLLAWIISLPLVGIFLTFFKLPFSTIK